MFWIRGFRRGCGRLRRLDGRSKATRSTQDASQGFKIFLSDVDSGDGAGDYIFLGGADDHGGF